jgi:type II secretory pathway pseudopilin PulG
LSSALVLTIVGGAVALTALLFLASQNSVYVKWNERLFHEVYRAYLDGRGSDQDPSVNWYEGEIAFFDFYIIPLAKKLKECGVFGVSSDEYLTYARANRGEWERKGRGMVAGYLKTYEKES